MARIAGVLAAMVITAACTSGDAVEAERSDVASLEIVPVPEGPPGPHFVRDPRGEFELPIEGVQEWIPSPLPEPLGQGISCEFGGNLVMELRDGGVLTYGPCERPTSIDRLWARMVLVFTDGSCRPGCGPVP